MAAPVIKLLSTIKNINYGKIPLALGLLYGLALPIASLFLKGAAEAQQTFLFIDNPRAAEIIFWHLTVFTVAVSLSKVFSFLHEAYKNRLFAFLACVGFEAAFIAVDNKLCTIFFLIVVALANIIQAVAGFLSGEEINDIKPLVESAVITSNKIEAVPNSLPVTEAQQISDVPQPHVGMLISPELSDEEPVRFWTPEKIS